MISGSAHQSTKIAGNSPDPDMVRAALGTVLDSDEFEGAVRLQSFLEYVVEQSLAGRSPDIRAKSVAEDVYGIALDQGVDPLAVVRVDAGRLRRRLDVYYGGTGLDDPMRIHIDSGGYAPRFELLRPDTDAKGRQSAKTSVKRWWVGVAAFLVVFLLGLGWFGYGPRGEAAKPGDQLESAERDALFSASPAKLQAKNLAEDAQNLMFPALDRQRLVAALSLFEQVIALDRTYYAGFAGAGQINALLASQMPASPTRDDYLSDAKQRATHAIKLAPEEPGSQSAMAMMYFAGKDCTQAATYSERAMRLDPSDLYARNFDVIIALFCGEFDRAVNVAEPAIGTSALSERLVFRNAAAAAEFHRGNYHETIEIYTAAINSGAPVGALTLAYLAAAHSKLGREQEARGKIELLKEAWPDFDLEQFLLVVFVDPGNASELIAILNRIGWRTDAR